MTLPGDVRSEVEERLGPILSVRAVGGGCINPSARLETPQGAVFLKYNSRAPDGLFAVEAEGLRQLGAADTGLRVPEVLGFRDGHGGTGWLALEWLEPGRRDPGVDQRLGEGLAALHRASVGGWGWEHDGYIGALPQANSPCADWAAFWWERRLEPQLRMARDAERQPGGAAEWDLLLSRLPEALGPAEGEGPSLLHGDLWSGNVVATSAGEAALVDPAVYRGHREVDLAMTELFGGFGTGFYGAYAADWPLLPGYEEVRRGIYQLFYLLVHVNHFGSGYVEQTRSVLRQVLAAT